LSSEQIDSTRELRPHNTTTTATKPATKSTLTTTTTMPLKAFTVYTFTIDIIYDNKCVNNQFLSTLFMEAYNKNI